MKILFTASNYYPDIGGVEKVVQCITEGLYKKGHHVTVATSCNPNRKFKELNGVNIEEFNISGNKVKRIKGDVHEYIDFLVRSDFDIIANYAAQTWTTDLTFDVLDKIRGFKVLLPCGYSGLALWTKKFFYWNYFRRLPGYLRKYDHIIYHSNSYIDKFFGDKHGISHYSIIPNGVSLDEIEGSDKDFRKKYGIDTPYLLLNISNHFKLKNHRFVLSAFQKLNRDDVTLVIIGNKVPDFRGCHRRCMHFAADMGRKVKFLENLPREYVISALKQADIFVFASKVECFPLVILEAMATRTPFISTDVGAVKEMHGGIIVNSQQQMVSGINELLSNPQKKHQLANIGYDNCIQNYVWDKIITQYENLFLTLIRTAGGKS